MAPRVDARGRARLTARAAPRVDGLPSRARAGYGREVLSRSALASIVALAASLAAPLAAQAPASRGEAAFTGAHEHVVRILGEPTFAGRAELWARRVAHALEREGARVVTPDVEQWDGDGFDEGRLALLERLASALEAARRAQAALDEGEALRSLSAASELAREALDVPSATAWLAEIEVATAIIASERGDAELAEASLRRALSLAPDRALGEGEASPALVARSRAIRREEVRRARVEVRLAPTATPSPAARIFVDDRELGSLPREVEVSAGAHVLRVEAEGRRPYARLVTFAPGVRAPWSVALAPSRATVLAQALEEAIRGGSLEAVAALLARIEAEGGAARTLWLVSVGTGALDRALVVRCEAGGCARADRLEGSEAIQLHPDAPLARAEGPRIRATERAWIDEVPGLAPEPSSAPILDAWWLWAGIGVAVVGAAVGVGLAATSSEQPALVLRVDPCSSCGR